MKARIVMILMAVALIALPTMAQDQWQSTSTMRGTGNYVAPVTEVGANSAISVATTTDDYSPAKAPGGPRKIDVYTPNTDPNASVGDALIPLMLMALAFCGVVYYRRKKALKS